MDDQTIARKARSILNKLTVEKFDALYEQFATIGAQTPAQVAILMREVFDKATQHHHFIAMYAELRARLETDERIAPAVSGGNDSATSSGLFRRLLMDECQTAFERLLRPPEAAVEHDDEEARMFRKGKALGNVKFVGQLIVRGMPNSSVLCSYAEQLLDGQEECPAALESLAALLTVVGPTFDVAGAARLSKLEAIFAKVSRLTGDLFVPPRLRFLLRDVLDQREAGWPTQPRVTSQPVGPMRLDEVREQRAAEESKSNAVKQMRRTGSGEKDASNSRQAALQSIAAKPRETETVSIPAATTLGSAAHIPVRPRMDPRRSRAPLEAIWMAS